MGRRPSLHIPQTPSRRGARHSITSLTRRTRRECGARARRLRPFQRGALVPVHLFVGLEHDLLDGGGTRWVEPGEPRADGQRIETIYDPDEICNRRGQPMRPRQAVGHVDDKMVHARCFEGSSKAKTGRLRSWPLTSSVESPRPLKLAFQRTPRQTLSLRSKRAHHSTANSDRGVARRDGSVQKRGPSDDVSCSADDHRLWAPSPTAWLGH